MWRRLRLRVVLRAELLLRQLLQPERLRLLLDGFRRARIGLVRRVHIWTRLKCLSRNHFPDVLFWYVDGREAPPRRMTIPVR